MSRPLIQEINVIDGAEVVREMNDEEYAQYLIDQERSVASET